jgi:hypothetical protein
VKYGKLYLQSVVLRRLDAASDREDPGSITEQYTWDARSNTEAGYKICRKEIKVLQNEPDTT